MKNLASFYVKSFGGGLRLDDRALTDGINVLIKTFYRECCPFCHVKIQPRKKKVCDLEEGPHLSHRLPDLVLPASRTEEENSVVCKSPSLWNFAMAAGTD